METGFLDAVRQIARDKEVTEAQLREMVEQALITAYRKNPDAQPGQITVEIDEAGRSIRVLCEQVVVDDDEPEFDENTMIYLDEAQKHEPKIKIGQVLRLDVTQHAFGRIAAQTAKQVVMQKLKEAEREKVFREYSARAGQALNGVVQRREHRNVLVDLGKIEGILTPEGQVPGEPYRFNDRLRVLITEVRMGTKGPQVILSRTHAGLIRQLFELEVPEIADGIVLIKAVAREPGARSKIAVTSKDDRVDPVGSCVGQRGARVQAVVNELYGVEKIDIIRWSGDTKQFVAEAISPAKSATVTLDENSHTALVVVPDNQLSLAIGKQGQNVRLAARLTNWRIDIRSESQMVKPETPEAPEVPETPETEAAEVMDGVAEAEAVEVASEAPATEAAEVATETPGAVATEAAPEAVEDEPVGEAGAESPAADADGTDTEATEAGAAPETPAADADETGTESTEAGAATETPAEGAEE